MNKYICVKCGKTGYSDNPGIPNGWLISEDEYGNDVELCSTECMLAYDKVIDNIKNGDYDVD